MSETPPLAPARHKIAVPDSPHSLLSAHSSPMILFLALLFFALAIAGATAFVIFWPLALVHLRDRHPDAKARLGSGAFLRPAALWWLRRRKWVAW